MRLFLKRFALFLLLVGALAAALHALTLRAFRNEEKLLQDAAWAQQAAATETLLIGDSHADESVDADRLTACFPYAAGGENLLFAAAKLEGALTTQATPRLRHVVLAVGRHSFTATCTLPPGDAFYYARHVDAWKLAEETGEYAEYLRFWLRGTVVPWAGQAPAVLPLLDRAWRKSGVTPYRERKTAFYAGAPPAFADRPDRAAAARRRALDHLLGRAPFHPAPIAALGRIRQLCRERGLTLTVVDAPVTDLYDAEISRLVDPARYAAVLDQELVAHGITPLDLHDLFFAREDLFRDPDHLRREGRDQVTALVAAAIPAAQVPH